VSARRVRITRPARRGVDRPGGRRLARLRLDPPQVWRWVRAPGSGPEFRPPPRSRASWAPAAPARRLTAAGWRWASTGRRRGRRARSGA